MALTKERPKTQDGEQRLTKDVYARVTDRIIADLAKTAAIGCRKFLQEMTCQQRNILFALP